VTAIKLLDDPDAAQMTFDLAHAATVEALDAITRHARLMPDIRHQPLVVLVAAMLLEAKARSLRRTLSGFASHRLNAKLAKLLDEICADETKAETDKLAARFARAAR
jgi:hypothetical protein